MDERVFLILHGWGGNKPEHWQEYLYTQLTEAGCPVHYPFMPSPESPQLSDWLAAICNEMGKIARHYPQLPLTVVAHSLPPASLDAPCRRRRCRAGPVVDCALRTHDPYSGEGAAA